eukprot:GHVN01066245.1.p1 GENE.GHVN01066245.1~~GHVN01066245.1.p1  ORF type:complete len:517 (+),score=-53.36 GHVN01066245.1:1966-3516(+)
MTNKLMNTIKKKDINLKFKYSAKNLLISTVIIKLNNLIKLYNFNFLDKILLIKFLLYEKLVKFSSNLLNSRLYNVINYDLTRLENNIEINNEFILSFCNIFKQYTCSNLYIDYNIFKKNNYLNIVKTISLLSKNNLILNFRNKTFFHSVYSCNYFLNLIKILSLKSIKLNSKQKQKTLILSLNLKKLYIQIASSKKNYWDIINLFLYLYKFSSVKNFIIIVDDILLFFNILIRTFKKLKSLKYIYFLKFFIKLINTDKFRVLSGIKYPISTNTYSKLNLYLIKNFKLLDIKLNLKTGFCDQNIGIKKLSNYSILLFFVKLLLTKFKLNTVLNSSIIYNIIKNISLNTKDNLKYMYYFIYKLCIKLKLIFIYLKNKFLSINISFISFNVKKYLLSKLDNTCSIKTEAFKKKFNDSFKYLWCTKCNYLVFKTDFNFIFRIKFDTLKYKLIFNNILKNKNQITKTNSFSLSNEIPIKLKEFKNYMSSNVFGQLDTINTFIETLSKYYSGLKIKNKPFGS